MVTFYGRQFSSRLLIGTALYPSPAVMQQAIRASGAEIVTVSLRREAAGGKAGNAFWSLINELGVTVLPNTAGCRTVREAVTTAKLARELFGTPWIKLEVIADDETLQPDVVGLVEVLPEPVESATGDFTWSPDSNWLFWIWRDDNGRPAKIFRRPARGGTGDDVLVYEEPDDGFFLSIGRTSSDAYIVIGAGDRQCDHRRELRLERSI